MFRFHLQFLAAFLHFPLAKCLHIYGFRLKAVWDNKLITIANWFVCVGSNIFCKTCHVVFDIIVKLFFPSLFLFVGIKKHFGGL